MSHIWLFFLLASLVSGGLSGQLSHLSVAAMQGAQEGAQLALSLAGALCLWSAVSRVMEKSGLSEKLSQLLSPLAHFPGDLPGWGSAQLSLRELYGKSSRARQRSNSDGCFLRTPDAGILP